MPASHVETIKYSTSSYTNTKTSIFNEAVINEGTGNTLYTAEQNAAADKAEREKIDKMNQADSMIFSTENFLKDNGDKIPADKKPGIEQALQQLKDAHNIFPVNVFFLHCSKSSIPLCGERPYDF